MYQVVIDTNVLVAALRSRLGASYRLIDQLGDSRWRPNLTVAVVLEYEAVLKRDCREFGLTEQDIDDAVDAICSLAGLHRMYFLWRPVAADPDDDLILEAAIASHSDFIITFNKRDFPDSGRFGIRCLTPKEFLILMERQS
ncbi:MAG TPA: putative toxin-antitoxin system toxin component, PIN family [Acidobacteriaceae bacterium]|jgi:putative PIN family toxin of toxin-antitoxin system|nr:putative toxin-antitoxin system toxin component, PIN family [Acidobacteriaceae bacterium]